MVSNRFNTKHRYAKSPVVCLAPPTPPIRPLEFTVEADPETITIYDSASINLWGDHPARPKGEDYVVEWTVAGGTLDPPPVSYNREPTSGSYLPTGYPGTFLIKALARWVDGTTAFALCTVTVTLE